MKRVTLASVFALVLTMSAGRTSAADAPSLVEAARSGDRAVAKALLQKGAKPDSTTADGTTALHFAVEHDDVELVELLLKAGASATAANRYGVTPLFLAAQNGHAGIIERLLKAGADARSANADGETVLMTAARTGRLEAVKLLLAHGADASAREKWRGQTALMWAAGENQTDVVQTLIEAGADPAQRSNGGFTPLLFAVRAGRIETVRTLIAKGGGNPNDAIDLRPAGASGAAPRPTTTSPPTGNEAGRSAADQAARLTTLFQVFNSGSWATRRTGPGTNALILAIMNGHFELASVLLNLGADPNGNGPGWTALHQLAWTRRPPIQHGL